MPHSVSALLSESTIPVDASCAMHVDMRSRARGNGGVSSCGVSATRKRRNSLCTGRPGDEERSCDSRGSHLGTK